MNGWRKIVKTVATWVILLFLTACSSIRYLTIEVQEPAPITVPPDVRKLLLVNNSVSQPSSTMYEGTTIKESDLEMDSVPWMILYSSAENVIRGQFFDEIGVDSKSIRKDDEWLSIVPLSKEFQEDIFEKKGFDGILSIDRILYRIEDRMKSHIDIRIKFQLMGSIYVYDREEPLTTFFVKDSLMQDFGELENFPETFKLWHTIYVKEWTYWIGERIAHHIIPSWTTKNRILYTGNNARMKEGYSFIRTEKWAQAQQIWITEYNQKKRSKDKGKLAQNLAVINEIQDSLEEALRWAMLAQTHFNETDLSTDSDERVQINAYIEILQKRIKDNQLLNIQWGTEY